MWPFWIFASLVLVVLLDFWWRDRERRRQLARTAKEYTTAALRQQQQAIALAQAQQRAVFDSMIEGVLLLDPNGKIQLVNRSLTRLLSLNGDVTGKSLEETFRWPGLQELMERVASEKRVIDSELEFSGPTFRWFQINGAAYVDQKGQPQGTLLVFHDMTRLKQLENTRKEFVANVSHELRTPLSMIKGYVETLLEGAKDDPAQAGRFLQIIDKHADRLTYLIEDLLTISKLESGQIVMNLQRVNLRELAQRVGDDLRSRAEEKKITVEISLSSEFSVQADVDRLQQVFFNLVENAIKYGQSQGHVCIGAQAREEGQIEIWIRDDGPGIPSDAQDRVFERFFRIDKARSRETGGTGLGLAIVKHIVQAHGGKVWLESELGRGSTFFFRLPKA